MTATFRTAYTDTRATHSPNGNGQHPATRRAPLLAVAGRLAARAVSRWQVWRTAALSTAAFGVFTVAAWMTDTRLGLITAGVSLLVLEWLASTDSRSP